MTPVGLLLSIFAWTAAFGLGPKGTSFIYGSILDIFMAEDSRLQHQWVKQYGKTLRYKGSFLTNRLFTMDTCAVNHVLRSSVYQKPSYVRYGIAQMLGEGLLFAEGVQHRQQRRILNPAFGPAQTRALTGIFFSKAIRLRDVWSSEIVNGVATNTIGARIDIVLWLSRMALDVIGLAGFNYDFDALNANEQPNELNEAYATMNENQKFTILPVLQAWISLLHLVPGARDSRIQVAKRTMTRIAKELLTSAKATARACATEKGEIEKSSLHGRDLLTLLVKANMATDVPDSQRLSDEDVLAQVPTFLVTGHETTSTAVTWALYAMGLAPEIQTKLREELISVGTETPSMEDLMALPYLDAVVRETLRLYTPFPNIARTAMKDDVIPLEQPFTDKRGIVHHEIRIREGDLVIIPILAMNTSEELWGDDAHEFKPERWDNVPEAVSRIPGLWSHLLTFLGGPRSCIGYRFALVQMKVVLFTLIRAFEFELAVPASEIGKHSLVMLRPFLRGDPTKKPQLPLLFKRSSAIRGTQRL
ncbi:cytochrome P450 [Melanogaster broomeanus]|nr:cytochrome P450 [Melanogaster broomeanus]